MRGLWSPLVRLKAVFVKEFAWYFNNPGGFVLVALFIGFSNFLYFKDFFINGNATMRPYFLFVPWLTIFLTAGVSMRTFSDERRSGTFEVLLSLPLSEGEIVLGKFLAALSFFLACLAASFTVPLTLSVLGKPDGGAILAGYTGLLLFAAACFSVGIFISSLTHNQVVSLLVSVLALFLLTILGDELIVQQSPRPLAQFFAFAAFSSHFGNFARGVIDLRDVVFFLTVSLGFLFLSVKSIENRG